MTFMRVLARDVRVVMLALLLGSAVTLRAATPTLTSISPARGVTAGGEAVTLTGTGFTGTTGVFFGGAAATSFNVVSDTQIDAITPARNPGPVDVVVTNADGSATLPEGFLYGIVPLAVADTYSTPRNTALTVAAPGVLGNDDNSLENGTLTAVLIANVRNGVLDLKADGSFVYTPNTGFNGEDTFTYRASNSAGQGNQVTVTIAIQAPRQPLNLFAASVEGNLVTLRWTTNPGGHCADQPHHRRRRQPWRSAGDDQHRQRCAHLHVHRPDRRVLLPRPGERRDPDQPAERRGAGVREHPGGAERPGRSRRARQRHVARPGVAQHLRRR